MGDVDTSESIYNFLENQVDESKKLVSSVLRFKGTIGEFVDDFLESFDSEEQSELHVAINKYSKFLVATYTRGFHAMSDEDPILIRHSKAPTDDVMIQTMNENNWHEFLSDSISGALENSQAANRKGRISKEGQWIRNIFRRLNKYFRVYSMLFEELAAT